MMRLACIADLHGRLPDIPECDILILAGDVAPDFPKLWDADVMRARQSDWLDTTFRAWEASVPARHILMTPGNHDWFYLLPKGLRTRMFIDEGCEIDGGKFWFTPWVSPVGSWNYMLLRHQRKDRFAEIPKELDVLVAHSPAYRVSDLTVNGDNVGCPELRGAILRQRPKHCVFGHIHECSGQHLQLSATKMHNVAADCSRMPFMLDLVIEKVEESA